MASDEREVSEILLRATGPVAKSRERCITLLAEFSIVPMGAGEGISRQVARCLEVVERSRLAYRINPMGTVVEGDFEQVMSVIGECHRMMSSEYPRVLTTIRIDDRKGVTGALDSKIGSVEKRLGRELRK